MSEGQKASASLATQETTQQATLLDSIVEEGRFGQEPSSQERGKDIIKEFIGQVLQGEVTVSKDTEAMINARIAQIDHLISLQLNEILHHPHFQKLEGSWRGLKYTLDSSETSTMLKIRVMNVSKKELLKDLQRATEFDQSAIFKKVYEEEYGVFGGEPFAAHDRRLRIHQASGRHRAARKDVACGCGSACAVSDGGRAGTDESGQLSESRPAARYRKDFRLNGVREVEELPRERGFALRRSRDAAYFDAAAVRPRYEAGGRLCSTKKLWTEPTTRSIYGATRPMRWPHG